MVCHPDSFNRRNKHGGEVVAEPTVPVRLMSVRMNSDGERPIYYADAAGTSALMSSPCNSLTVNDTSK